MIEKAIDAATMFWEALDVQERIVLGYLVVSVALAVFAQHDERAREERIARKVAAMVRASGD